MVRSWRVVTRGTTTGPYGVPAWFRLFTSILKGTIMKTILILGCDGESSYLAGALSQASERCRTVFVDPWKIHAEGDRLTIYSDSTWELIVDGTAVTDCYKLIWRSYDGYHDKLSQFEHIEARSLFESWLNLLAGRSINPYTAWLKHQHKPSQFCRLARHKALKSVFSDNGPDTAWSSDSGSIDGVGELIWKPITSGDVVPIESFEQVRGLFGTIQDRQQSEVLRAYVVRNKVVAAFHIRYEGVDYRRTKKREIKQTDLTESMSLACEAIAESEDCTAFCAIEFLLSPSGKWLFGEVNPSPMFVGFDSHCGGKIGRALVNSILHEEVQSTKTVQEEATQHGD